MRIYKCVTAYSSKELDKQVDELEREGWHPGPPRIEVDALYPHRCHMYKDLKNRKKEAKNA